MCTTTSHSVPSNLPLFPMTKRNTEQSVISIPSSSSSQDSPQNRKQKLQFIVQSQPDWWSYAIFWQTTNTVSKKDTILVWGDGYFQGNKHTGIHEPLRKNLLSGSDISKDGNVADPEWFYLMSLTSQFPAGFGLPGKALSTGSLVWLKGAKKLQLYNCERTKEARLHGIHTIFCIPTLNGVLEMGSPNSVLETSALVRKVKFLFGSASDVSTTSILQAGNHAQKSRKTASQKTRARSTAIGHAEFERQRREKLNSCFHALRGAVPMVSRMDRASLLSDAVAYINKLTDKIKELESQLKRVVPTDAAACAFSDEGGPMIEIRIKIVGVDAMIRVESKNVKFPAARLMDALQNLDLKVYHASVCNVQEIMLQEVRVKVPEGVGSEEDLKSAIQIKLID